MKNILSTLFLTVLIISTAGYASSPDPDWPDTLHGEGEFMIFLHSDLRSSLYKVVVTIKKLSGTTLYTGSTYKEVDDEIYLLDYPFSCTDYLTEETITFTRDSDYIQNHSQLNRYDYETGHIGHSYDTILQTGSSSRPVMLGYGTYEISMKYYDSPYTYSNQRWYVDLQDPYYPYDTHGFSTYYDICLCVNEGNGDYSASAYLANKSWNAWKLIYPDSTGRLTDAFYSLRSHRLEALGLGASSFQHVPLSVYVSGPSTLYARYLSSPRSFGENHQNGGSIDLPAALPATATGTYTANPDCGTQQYTYQWHLKKPGWTVWIYKGSGKSVTITQTSDFYIRCTCTSGTETETDTKFVDVIIDDDPLP